MKVRIIFSLFLVVFCLTPSLSFASTNTNEVILPQTEFFAEGAVSPVIEERSIYLPSREDKKDLYDTPSIKSVDILEREAKKEISQDVRSKLISLFSYGLNDILNFSIIGLSQIPVDTLSVSTVIKYDRFKRPDIVFYGQEQRTLRNTLKESDLASVSVGLSSSSVFWNTIFEFSEEFKGLWNNQSYLDEKDRDVLLNSKLRYRIDKESTLNLSLGLNHYYANLRDRSFNSLHTSLNDFFFGLGYKFGVEDYNFFGIDLGVGAGVFKLTYENELKSGVYGDLSISFSIPIYENRWFVGLYAGVVPDTFFPIEWYSRLGVIHKFSDTFSIKLSVFKDYDRFTSSSLSKGLNILTSVPRGDSYIGVELSPRVFFLGNNSLSLFVGLSYYLNKYYDRLQADSYVIDYTNATALYSKLNLDIISLDWLNFGGVYRLLFFFPSIPYISQHSVELNTKVILGSFNFLVGVFGETSRLVEFNGSELHPYLGLSFEIEWEVIKNFSILLKFQNVLNNLVEIRKDSVVLEPFYFQGGVKIKL
ncbi:MAG: hypothetical protein N3D81_04920 [Spirochaetes bacterium]|nr:hypothetical protein [Spirochaetota bacterium]